METPFLYRVHEKPDQMKMEQLKHFAATLGFTLKGSCSNIHPKAVRTFSFRQKAATVRESSVKSLFGR